MKTKTIRRKVAKRVLLAMFIAILALSLANLIYLFILISGDQKKELNLSVRLTAGKIESWQKEITGIADTIAKAEEANGEITAESTYGLVNQIAEERQDLFYIYVANENGDIFMARGVQFAKGVDIRERAWYKKVKEAGKSIVTDPYISATSPDVIMATIATPVYVDGKFIGAVGIDCEIQTMARYVNSLELKEDSYAVLIDSNKNIVTHPNEDYLPTTSKEVSVKEAIPELEKIIGKKKADIVSGKDYKGMDMMYAAADVGDSGWVVAMASPKSAYMKHITRAIVISALIALICILLAAGDIAITIKKILLPIEKINPAMEKILEGDFTSRIEFTHEQDELGQLQNKMAQMVKQLSGIVNEQKHVLNEISSGNLVVDDMKALPGELNEISESVNDIKAAFNDIISDIQFSAITLESYAMGINDTRDMEEMKAIFTELSAEADELMKKTERFVTIKK